MTDTHHPDRDGWDRLPPWCILTGTILAGLGLLIGMWIP